ncbi:MAG TPA: ATP-binding protein, partial [Gemmataceae bacterium]|nr:ATP-binding protein [Gemmataceae bacterium]
AIGKTDFDFFTQEHAEPAFHDEQEVIRTGQPIVAKEEKETWADGRTRWVLSTKLPLRDVRGNIVGTFGISRNITARKEAQAQLEQALASLRASEARFRRLFESNIIGIMFADTSGRISDANDAFLNMVGYTRADLPLRWDTQLTPPAYRTRTQVAIQQLGSTGVTVPYEKEYLRKDGTLVPILVGGALLEGSGGQIIAFVLDMTERNRMRRMLMQTEKLASIGLLSAGIAHEINNPLAYVANNLAVLERDLPGLLELIDTYEQTHSMLETADPQALHAIQERAEALDLPYLRANLERLLTRSREGVQRIAKIVGGLRGIARSDPDQMQEARLADLIESAVEMAQGQFRRQHVTLEVDCPPGIRLRCVGMQISQVLLNLLINALHAIEAAGRSDGQVRLTAQSTGDEVVIEVTDNGVGIGAEDLPRIFDPFFTRKAVGEGTGLGLSISHGLVTGHGGRIEVSSRPGAGSTFRACLPVHGVARAAMPNGEAIA